MTAAPTTAMGEIRREDLLRVVLSSALVAVPVSLVALGFLGLVDLTQEWVWQTLPADLGYKTPPWWWPVPWLALAGLLVGAAVVTLSSGLKTSSLQPSCWRWSVSFITRPTALWW